MVPQQPPPHSPWSSLPTIWWLLLHLSPSADCEFLEGALCLAQSLVRSWLRVTFENINETIFWRNSTMRWQWAWSNRGDRREKQTGLGEQYSIALLINFLKFSQSSYPARPHLTEQQWAGILLAQKSFFQCRNTCTNVCLPLHVPSIFSLVCVWYRHRIPNKLWEVKLW